MAPWVDRGWTVDDAISISSDEPTEDIPIIVDDTSSHEDITLRQASIQALAPPPELEGLRLVPVEVESYRITVHQRSRVIRRSYSYELTSTSPDSTHRSFFRVHGFLQNAASREIVACSGLLIKRNHSSVLAKRGHDAEDPPGHTSSMLKKVANECHIVVEKRSNDRRAWYEQGLIAIPKERIIASREREIIFTNALSSQSNSGRLHGRQDKSFRDAGHRFSKDDPFVQTQLRLVCRWVMIKEFEDSIHQSRFQWSSVAVQRLNEVDLAGLRMQGGQGIEPVSDAGLLREWKPDLPGPQGPFDGADVCCCGGGASSAMLLSNSVDTITCGIDIDPKVGETYRDNIPDADFYLGDMTTILPSNVLDDQQVSMMHISPPCTPWSTLARLWDPDRPENQKAQAALFAVGGFIEKFRPLILSIENTLNLMDEHAPWFHRLVEQCTDRNYSVYLRRVDFRDYGLASRRLRVILLASAPGMKAPPMADATHAEAPSVIQSKRPWETVNKAIKNIPPDATHHLNNTRSHRFFEHCKSPYDGDALQAACITKNGGDSKRNYHPDGLRTFTLRELACLNGFDYYFKLDRRISVARAMIGDAVPPSAMASLYGAIRAFLKEELERLQ